MRQTDIKSDDSSAHAITKIESSEVGRVPYDRPMPSVAAGAVGAPGARTCGCIVGGAMAGTSRPRSTCWTQHAAAARASAASAAAAAAAATASSERGCRCRACAARQLGRGGGDPAAVSAPLARTRRLGVGNRTGHLPSPDPHPHRTPPIQLNSRPTSPPIAAAPHSPPPVPIHRRQLRNGYISGRSNSSKRRRVFSLFSLTRTPLSPHMSHSHSSYIYLTLHFSAEAHADCPQGETEGLILPAPSCPIHGGL